MNILGTITSFKQSTVTPTTIVSSNLALYYDATNTECYDASISTTILNDLSGNGRTGTLTNGATVNQNGIVVVGTSPTVTQFVESNYAPSEFNTSGTQYTYELWFRDDAFGTVGGGTNTILISNVRNPTVDNYAIMHIGTTGSVLISEKGSGGTPSSYTSPVLSLGVWHHLVKTADNDLQKMYINGVLQGSVARVVGSLNSSPANSIRLGGGWVPRGQTCELGAMRVYIGKALTEAEVQHHYNLELPLFSSL